MEDQIRKIEVEEPRDIEQPSWWVINYPEDSKKNYTGELIIVLFLVIIISLLFILLNNFDWSGLMP